MNRGDPYNPFNSSAGGRTGTVRRLGDLGSVTSDSLGKSNETFFVGELTLVGQYSIVGRACAIASAPNNENVTTITENFTNSSNSIGNVVKFSNDNAVAFGVVGWSGGPVKNSTNVTSCPLPPSGT